MRGKLVEVECKTSLSQEHLDLLLKDKPEDDPFLMDWPVAPRPPIVGEVQRGVDEPSVGWVLDFSKCHWCALAFVDN